MADISDLTLQHPASYHYAIQCIRHANEAARTDDANHKTAIVTLTVVMDTAIEFSVDYDFLVGGQVAIVNRYSRHLGWLSRELYYKWKYASTGAQAAAIVADVDAIKVLVAATTA